MLSANVELADHGLLFFRTLSYPFVFRGRQGGRAFRLIYNKCKADIVGKNPSCTKMDIHNAGLNRTTRMLGKHVFRRVEASVVEAEK